MSFRALSTTLALLLVLGAAACAAEPEPEPAAQTTAVQLETDEQKLLYALGMVISARLPHFEMTEPELALIQAGLVDGIQGKQPRVDMKAVAPKIEPYLLERVNLATQQEKAAGQTFREAAAKQPGAVTLDSGLIYQELQAGSGTGPGPQDTVKIRYRGTLRDGSEFDSADEPVGLSLGGVVPCFSEGLQRMKTGGKSKLVCPPELAYGDNGFPPRIRPGATLTFEVELVEVVPAGQAKSATE